MLLTVQRNFYSSRSGPRPFNNRSHKPGKHHGLVNYCLASPRRRLQGRAHKWRPQGNWFAMRLFWRPQHLFAPHPLPPALNPTLSGPHRAVTLRAVLLRTGFRWRCCQANHQFSLSQPLIRLSSSV